MNANNQNHKDMKKGNYTKFFLMLAASFVAMYITMYLNTYEWDHVWFSLTRFLYGMSGNSSHGHNNVCGYAWHV